MSADRETPAGDVPVAAGAAGGGNGETLETKLERLATFSLLTVSTLLRLIEDMGIEKIGPGGYAKLAEARGDVEQAIAELDAWKASEAGQRSDLDLEGLRARMEQMAATLDVDAPDEEPPPS